MNIFNLCYTITHFYRASLSIYSENSHDIFLDICLYYYCVCTQKIGTIYFATYCVPIARLVICLQLLRMNEVSFLSLFAQKIQIPSVFMYC